LEAKAALEKAVAAVKASETLTARMDELEQKAAQGAQRGTVSKQTYGDIVLASDEIKQFIAGRANKASVEVKTILTANGDGVPDKTLVPSARGELVVGARRVLRLEDVIPSGNIDSSSYEFPRELAVQLGATNRADGAAATESGVTFELVQRNVQEITTWIPVSKNALADAPVLKAHLDQLLSYAVDFKSEQQIFAGSGVGLQIYGLTSAGSFTPFEPAAGETVVDGISRAIEQVQLANYSADTIVLHPSVWFAIGRMKTTTGEYVFGSPLTGLITPTLFGIPVVVTAAIPVGKVLVMNAAVAFKLLNRSGIVVSMAEQHADLFIKGCVALLATRRLVLAGQRPASVAYGDLQAT
jgi:HK97 family phage major capsid protein